MRWNLKKLRNNVKHLYGESQQGLLSPCLESIINRKKYSRYHFQEFEKLLSEFLSDKQDKISLSKIVFSGNEEEISNFDFCRTQAEANILACLQSMHSISDIMSHVIYYSFNMNLDSNLQITRKNISINSVLKKLSSIPKYSTLCKNINLLITHPDYKYLADIVNHSKHRSIIGTSFTVSFKDGYRRHGLEFLKFEYEGKPHINRWVDDYLEGEYKRQDLLLIDIGNEINRIVNLNVVAQI